MDAKNLIRQCLAFNPKERITANAALSHAWIKNRVNKPDVFLKRDHGGFALLESQQVLAQQVQQPSCYRC